MAITKIPAAGFTGNNFRNIIINGDMSIAQRGTSVVGTTDGYKICDRWYFKRSVGTINLAQSAQVPTGQGFAQSFQVVVTSGASPSAGDRQYIEQRFEGQNLQYLKKGTANAESVTLSFWIKSSVTGTYIIQLYDVDNDRSISKSYTIDSADTWEKKTITFAGDTTGAFGNDNSHDLSLRFFFSAGTNYTSGTLQTSWGANVNANQAVGQVNFPATASNELYLTGVQLEAGTTASDFEFLPYDVNKTRCKRYFQKTTIGSGRSQGSWVGLHWSGSVHIGSWSVETEFRTDPTIGYGGSFALLANGTDGYGYTPSGGYQHSYGSVVLNMNGTARATSHAVVAYSDNANTFLSFDAEL